MRFFYYDTLLLAVFSLAYTVCKIISVHNRESRPCILLPEMTDTAVMGNPDCPRYKSAVIKVMAIIKGIDYFYKYLLEDIFCNIPVFYKQHDGSKDPGLMT